MQRAEARAAARKRKGGGGEEGEDENWESVESMTVREGRAAGAHDGELQDKFSELDESSEEPGALR